jgi:hypothetical protein
VEREDGVRLRLRLESDHRGGQGRDHGMTH